MSSAELFDVVSAFEPPGAPPIRFVGSFVGFDVLDAVGQGADGMTYIVASAPLEILRMDPRSASPVNTIQLPTRSQPVDITPGPDGNVWFTDRGLNQVGRLTPSGHLTFFNVPSGTLGAITAASDNALWFVDGHNIDRISTDGQQVTSYPVPSSDGDIGDIASGPAGSCIPGKIFFANMHGLGIVTFSK